MKKISFIIISVILITSNIFGQSNNKSQSVRDFIIKSYYKDEKTINEDFKSFIKPKIIETENGQQEVNVFDFPAYTISSSYNADNNMTVMTYLFNNNIKPDFTIDKEYFKNIAKASVLNEASINRELNTKRIEDSRRERIFASLELKYKSDFAKKYIARIKENLPNTNDQMNQRIADQIENTTKALTNLAVSNTVGVINRLEADARDINNMNRITSSILGHSTNEPYNTNFSKIDSYLPSKKNR
jgi:hypothetical protein